MRKVTITVTNTKVGTAKLMSYPEKPQRKKYQVPLYKVKVSGKDKSGNNIEEDFEAIRFGIKRTKTINAHIVGLQDAQSYILSWDNIRTVKGKAWRVYAGFFVHKGPDYPSLGRYASIGCIEICGLSGWAKFNNKIKELTNCETEEEVSSNRLAEIVYQAAIKPPLIKV